MPKTTCLYLLLIGLLATGVGCESTSNETGGSQPEEPPSGPTPTLSWAQQQEALARHNHWRKAVRVSALSWSPSLAAYAQVWADELAALGCKMEHRPRGGAFEQRYGENLFWASPVMWTDGRREVQPRTPTHVIDTWGEQKQWYEYRSNRCAAPSGESCGHYTQMVWARSREVGCAMTICDNKGQIWVCNYDPPGNYIGQRPY